MALKTRMVHKVALFLMGFVLALPVAGYADDRLTLQQAIAATLANNPDLRAARAGERQSAASAGEARAAYLPRVDYLESWQRGDNPVFVFSSLLLQQRFSPANFDIATLNTPSPLVNYRGAFAVEQPVIDGARLAVLRSARLAQQMAGEEVRELAAALAIATATTRGSRASTTSCGRRTQCSTPSHSASRPWWTSWSAGPSSTGRWAGCPASNGRVHRRRARDFH